MRKYIRPTAYALRVYASNLCCHSGDYRPRHHYPYDDQPHEPPHYRGWEDHRHDIWFEDKEHASI